MRWLLAHLLCCRDIWHTKDGLFPLVLYRPRIFSNFRELKFSPNICFLQEIQSSNLNVPCVISPVILSEELVKHPFFTEAWERVPWPYLQIERSLAVPFPGAFGGPLSKITACGCRQKSALKQLQNTSLRMQRRT